MKRIAGEQLLQPKELEVYTLIYANGPMTRNELNQSRGSYKPLDRRLARLQARNVIKIIGDRICSKTGRKCAAYEITDALPGPPPKAEGSQALPTRETCRKAIDELKPLLRGHAAEYPAIMEVMAWLSRRAPPKKPAFEPLGIIQEPEGRDPQ